MLCEVDSTVPHLQRMLPAESFHKHERQSGRPARSGSDLFLAKSYDLSPRVSGRISHLVVGRLSMWVPANTSSEKMIRGNALDLTNHWACRMSKREGTRAVRGLAADAVTMPRARSESGREQHQEGACWQNAGKRRRNPTPRDGRLAQLLSPRRPWAPMMFNAAHDCPVDICCRAFHAAYLMGPMIHKSHAGQQHQLQGEVRHR